MNGGKDFCSWSKHDKELAATIGKVVQTVVGPYGAGLIEEALGESMYEKKEDDFQTLTYLSKASVKVENGGKKEMQFVITGLQVRMGIVHGDIEYSIRLMSSFREKCDEKTDQGILQNLESKMTVAVTYGDGAGEVDYDNLAAELEGQGFSGLERWELNGIPCLYYYNEKTCEISTIGDQGGVYTVVIGTANPDDEDEINTAMNILYSFSAHEEEEA